MASQRPLWVRRATDIYKNKHSGYRLLASSLWPLVSLLVEKHQLGTAYGFMQSWQNLGLALISIAVGAIAEKGWINIEMFFVGMAAGKPKTSHAENFNFFF